MSSFKVGPRPGAARENRQVSLIRYRRKGRYALLALVLPFLGACSLPSLSRDTEPVTTYLLALQDPAPPALAAKRPSILLSTPQSAPGFGTAAMIYVTEPHRLDQFALHRWADSPARMMEPVLVQALESSGRFSAVADAGSRVSADLRLDTEVLSLKQTFSDPNKTQNSEVELSVRVTLVDADAGRLIASRILSAKEPAGADPYSGVVAANRALARFARDLEALLAAELR